MNDSDDKTEDSRGSRGAPGHDPFSMVVLAGIVLVAVAGAAVLLRGGADDVRETKTITPTALPALKDTSAMEPRAVTATSPSAASLSAESQAVEPSTRLPVTRGGGGIVNFFDENRRVVYWWQDVPEGVRRDSIPTGEHSNMLREDYVGSVSCAKCHEGKHADWHGHAHRRMHELASEATVEGDFSGTGPASQIRYLGGLARFHTERGEFRMSLERGGETRTYSVLRTIGSRFFQYYVGKLIEGPDVAGLPLRSVEHVLPFGWWIDKAEWVPTVHVFRLTREDDEGFDPFSPDELSDYDSSCASCHTTVASGDWMLRDGGAKRLSWYTPRSLLLHVPGYLRERQPDFLPDFQAGMTLEQIVADTHEKFRGMPIQAEAAELGISCEACHNGCREHVKQSEETTSDSLPYFFPVGRNLFSEGADRETLRQTDLNRNFACSRCHSAARPQYASGHHTWNSTEYAEAVRGACYESKPESGHGLQALTCVKCHDPHKATGRTWARTPDQDDQSCLDCHQQFAAAASREAHTHHKVGSGGARCMNCHMPRINEGLQAMVRTHRIFNPTEKSMIEANQPNACNLCHLDKPIDWTIAKLQEWYGDDHEYDEGALVANYPNRRGGVGEGWLKSEHGATRLTAAAAFARQRDRAALPMLIESLAVEPKLINRQFAQKDLEAWLGVRLKERGYQFYMNPTERRAVVDHIKDELLSKAGLPK